jgi:hypothetical protein
MCNSKNVMVSDVREIAKNEFGILDLLHALIFV